MHWLLLYYLFVYIIIEYALSSAGKLSLFQPPRPGFESQVCINSYIILLWMFTGIFSVKVHHAPPGQALPRPLGDQSKGWELKNTYTRVNVPTRCTKKSKGPEAFGPGFLDQHLTNWDYTPTLVCKCFLFFSYLFFNYYFYCFNLIHYFHNT